MFIKFQLVFRFACDFRSSACERVKRRIRVCHTRIACDLPGLGASFMDEKNLLQAGLELGTLDQ